MITDPHLRAAIAQLSPAELDALERRIQRGPGCGDCEAGKEILRRLRAWLKYWVRSEKEIARRLSRSAGERREEVSGG